MRLRNQACHQFRLCANGVQPRRIQNHQPLLEQRVRDIDQCMTPSGHFNQAIRAGRRIVFGVAAMPKAERAGFVLRHMPHF